MSAAFYAVFAVFVVLMLGLATVSIRWALRRDRSARDRSARDRSARRSAEDRQAGDRPAPDGLHRDR